MIINLGVLLTADTINNAFRDITMKRTITVLFLLLAFIIGCRTPQAKFTLTGKRYPARSEKAEVKFAWWNVKENYEEIGIVEVRDISLDLRITTAEKIARENGGEVILSESMKMESDRQKFDKLGWMKQKFYVMKPKEVAETPRVEMEVKTPVNENKKLPRATYRLLTEEFRMLKGEKFKGYLYPKWYYKRIPRELRRYAGKDKRLLLLGTKRGKYRLLLIVPSDMTVIIKKKIKAKEELDFIYSPVALYRKRGIIYPVLEYINEIQ